MGREKLPMSLSINRVISNAEDDYIKIEVCDENSCNTFVTLKLSLKDYAMCISGLSGAKCEGEVRCLDRVGKKHEHKIFEFPLGPEDEVDFRDKKKAREIIQEVCPEGWIPDTSFNSQKSFFSKNNQRWASTTIRRWV